MWKYVLKRLAISVVTIFLILLLLFLMLEFMPGTPFNDEKLTEAQRAFLRRNMDWINPFLFDFLII